MESYYVAPILYSITQCGPNTIIWQQHFMTSFYVSSKLFCTILCVTQTIWHNTMWHWYNISWCYVAQKIMIPYYYVEPKWHGKTLCLKHTTRHKTMWHYYNYVKLFLNFIQCGILLFDTCLIWHITMWHPLYYIRIYHVAYKLHGTKDCISNIIRHNTLLQKSSITPLCGTNTKWHYIMWHPFYLA